MGRDMEQYIPRKFDNRLLVEAEGVHSKMYEQIKKVATEEGLIVFSYKKDYVIEKEADDPLSGTKFEGISNEQLHGG